MTYDRKHPWLYERDGDLNPTWLFVSVFLALGVAVVVGALLRGGTFALVGALSYLGAITIALLISALPRDKAKILARSKAPGEVAAGITGAVGRPFGGSSADENADEVLGG